MTTKPDVLIYAPWYEPAMRRLDEICRTHHVTEPKIKKRSLKNMDLNVWE